MYLKAVCHVYSCMCRQLRAEKEGEIRAAMEIKAQAQAFANALATIGKFGIKKKVGVQIVWSPKQHIATALHPYARVPQVHHWAG